MSLLLWLQRIFVPAPQSDEETENPCPDEPQPLFTWNQHFRILLAILVVFVSAIAIWWILA